MAIFYEAALFVINLLLLLFQSEVTCLSEAIGTCLDWIAESQLKQHTLILLKNDANNDLENDVCIEISSEKAFKVFQCSLLYLLNIATFSYFSVINLSET